MNKEKHKAEIEKCKQDITVLKAKLKAKSGEDEKASKSLPEASRNTPAATSDLKQRRILQGHKGKIYGVQWSKDNRNIVSAGQDGNMIIWNAFTTNKVQAIPLKATFVMTCAYSPNGDFVACGGLDNAVSIFKVPHPEGKKPVQELVEHEGYVACARFVTNGEMLTASGDQSCLFWDNQTGKVKGAFKGHDGDVMCVDTKENVFCSGSVDKQVKIWDYREQACVMTFRGHEQDVNSVQYFPDGYALASGSEDGSCKLWDTRACRPINAYTTDKEVSGVSSVAFSKSGRLLIAGYDDFNAMVWDTLLGVSIQTLSGHTDRLSALAVSPDGFALVTASFDTQIKVWA